MLGPVVALYGLAVAGMCVWMLFRPDSWCRAATRYCQHRFMHPIEFVIALGFGVIFIAFARVSVYFLVFSIFGYWLLATAIGLILAGPSRHRRYGVWSIEKIRPYLRLTAIQWFFLGGWIAWAGLKGI